MPKPRKRPVQPTWSRTSLIPISNLLRTRFARPRRESFEYEYRAGRPEYEYEGRRRTSRHCAMMFRSSSYSAQRYSYSIPSFLVSLSGLRGAFPAEDRFDSAFLRFR
jgi:hypothetical protein